MTLQRWSLLLCALAACTCEGRSQAQPEAQARAEPQETSPANETAKKPPPLSAEDIALIEADPKTLTPELRRKRGHALRRKIMQNPDSEAARNLERLRRAVEGGEIALPPKSGGLKFHAAKPAKPPEPTPSTPTPSEPTPSTPTAAEPTPSKP